jgi:tight adherence protein C
MSQAEILMGFFVFMMAAITAVGYFYIVRREPASARTPGISLVNPAASGLDTESGFLALLRRIGHAMPGAQGSDTPTSRNLSATGYRSPSAVAIFHGIKVAFGVVVGVGVAAAAVGVRGNLGSGVLPLICGLGFGYLLPDRILSRMASARGTRLRRGLPAALDMLVLTIEAGQSLDQAILDTAYSLRTTHPDLSGELIALHLESRTGNNRSEALRNFGERNNEPELRKVASLLIDTDRFGTSIGPALRSHAKYLRIRFRQQAQETARKVGVKLIFPVFFLIFPSVILVTLGPACILIFTQLRNVIGGG